MSWRKDNKVALENEAPRVDAEEKVTGKARYTTDYYPDKMLWAAYIRCPYGKAVLKSSGILAARKVEGVLEVDLTSKGGNYAGERIGHICAESREALEDGLVALNMQWTIQRPATSLAEERTPVDQINTDEDDQKEANAALENSDAVVEATYETQVQTHCCMEPHIAMVMYGDDETVAYGSTQGTFGFRNDIARIVGQDNEKVEFHCEYIGGGFGSKFGGGAEAQLAGNMSKKYKRPCRVGLDRKEEQLDAGNRPGSMQYMKVGATKDGKLQGGRIHTWGSVGPTGGGGGVRNPSRYEFGAVNRSHEDVHLNGGFPRAMRAPGHPQGMFGVEMFMDEMAAKLGMDPLKFRMLNETQDNRRRMMEVGAEIFEWKRRRADGTWPGTVKHGFGIGVGDWGNGSGNATILVMVHRNGTVEIRSGSQDIGTGYRTMLADCVASQIGLTREFITVKVGCSDYPPGPASGGSVTSRFTAPKAFGAAERARQAVLKLVASEWGVEPASLAIDENVITNGSKKMGWKEACKLINDDHLSFSVSENGDFWKEPTNSDAVQFVEVAVDTETGITRVIKIVALQDCGLPTNRHTVENQITGAVIQGLSFALFEDRILNQENGMMVNANMETYKIAGPVDVPEIIPVIWISKEDPGVNSLGEPPVIPTAGAIGCAVANAIGARVRAIPITPARVLAALEAKGGQS